MPYPSKSARPRSTARNRQHVPKPQDKDNVMSANCVPEALSDAVLGFDLGMTGSRACIMKVECKGLADAKPELVMNAKTNADSGNNRWDFPSTAYPWPVEFDPEVSLGAPDRAKAISFPLKMFFYLTEAWIHHKSGNVAKLGQIRRAIPHIEDLWKLIEVLESNDQEKLKENVRRIFLAHLKIVKAQVDEKSRLMGVRITQVAVTIPPNWDMGMQNEYLQLILQVWTEIESTNVTYIYESEAMGHWFFRLNSFQRAVETYNLYILADWGGHTLNSYSFEIIRRVENNRKAFAFYSIETAHCEHGGSELLATRIKAEIISQIQQRFNNITKTERKNLLESCMRDYRSRLQGKMSGKAFTLTGNMVDEDYRNGSDGNVDFRIKSVTSQKSYKLAFRDPLKKFRSHYHIRKSDKNNKDTVVVTSGGSFLNQESRIKTHEAVEGAGFEIMDCVEDMEIGRRSAVVCFGAALAIVHSETMDEFLSHAAFAVDLGCSYGEHVSITLNKKKSQWVTFEIIEGKVNEVMIVCAPIAPAANIQQIPRKETYQFKLIGSLKPGKYKIRLEYKTSEDPNQHPDWLILQHHRLVEEGRIEFNRLDKLPIFYDPGACVVFVDIDAAEGKGKPGSGRWDTRGGEQRLRVWAREQRDGGAKVWGDSLPDASGDAEPEYESEYEDKNAGKMTPQTSALDTCSRVSRSRRVGCKVTGGENWTMEARQEKMHIVPTAVMRCTATDTMPHTSSAMPTTNRTDTITEPELFSRDVFREDADKRSANDSMEEQRVVSDIAHGLYVPTCHHSSSGERATPARLVSSPLKRRAPNTLAPPRGSVETGSCSKRRYTKM